MSTETAAARIVEEILDRVAFTDHAAATGDGLAAGYAMQDRVTAHLAQPGVRGPVAGYKLAANSAKALAGMGLAEPLSAPIFADRCLESPADLRDRLFHTRAFEPEIAAIIGADIPAGVTDRAGVLPYVSRLVPAFEVLDLRGMRPSPDTVAQAVAQNIGNDGAVLGGPGLPPDAVDPDSLRLRVTFGDTDLGDVVGGAPQHPLDAVAWLAGHLAARGLALKAGAVVLCGTHTPMLKPEGPGRLTVTIDRLGKAVAELG